MLYHRTVGLIKPQLVRFKWSLLEKMAGMIARLSALDMGEHRPKPGDFSGPKPNALRDSPEEEPIPPLPSPLRGYPTPWLTEYDVLSYVYPLYTRGWGQSLKLWKPPPPKIEHKKPQLDRFTMLLSARYRFKDYESAASFFFKIAEAAKEENVSARCDIHIALNNRPTAPSIRTYRERDSVHSYGDHPNGFCEASNLGR